MNHIRILDSPVCLIQWLGQDKYRETREIISDYADKINITHFDVSTKGEVYDSLTTWFHYSKNKQFLYLGTHGSANGIGSSDSDFIEWNELWSWLNQSKTKLVLWLGACESSYAASAWTPYPNEEYYNPIEWLAGFNKIVNYNEVKDITLELMKTTSINNIIYPEELLKDIRNNYPGSEIEIYYPAHGLECHNGFYNIEKFKEKVGVSFEDFLMKKGKSKPCL